MAEPDRVLDMPEQSRFDGVGRTFRIREQRLERRELGFAGQQGHELRDNARTFAAAGDAREHGIADSLRHRFRAGRQEFPHEERIATADGVYVGGSLPLSCASAATATSDSGASVSLAT